MQSHSDHHHKISRVGSIANTINHGVTQLHVAASQNDVDTVTLLLKQGIASTPDDESNWTPLHRACHEGNIGVAARLVQHHVNVNAYDKEGFVPYDLLRERFCSDVSLRSGRGNVWSWGADSNMQLGYALQSRSTVQRCPKQVIFNDQTGHGTITKVATGKFHSLAMMMVVAIFGVCPMASTSMKDGVPPQPWLFLNCYLFLMLYTLHAVIHTLL